MEVCQGADWARLYALLAALSLHPFSFATAKHHARPTNIVAHRAGQRKSVRDFWADHSSASTRAGDAHEHLAGQRAPSNDQRRPPYSISNSFSTGRQPATASAFRSLRGHFQVNRRWFARLHARLAPSPAARLIHAVRHRYERRRRELCKGDEGMVSGQARGLDQRRGRRQAGASPLATELVRAASPGQVTNTHVTLHFVDSEGRVRNSLPAGHGALTRRPGTHIRSSAWRRQRITRWSGRRLRLDRPPTHAQPAPARADRRSHQPELSQRAQRFVGLPARTFAS
jgi:hypothetical protein